MKQKLAVIFCVVSCLFVVGCAAVSSDSARMAEQYAAQSDDLFREAVVAYEKALEPQAQSAAVDSSVYLRFGKLLFEHGRYERAQEVLSKSNNPGARRLLAFVYYKLGNYTDALSVFNALGESGDDEYRYYFGLTCEKQNLFDQARRLYSGMQSANYRLLAQERLAAIDSVIRQAGVKLDPFIEKIIKDASSEKQYLQAGAVILYCDERVTATPQNTLVTEIHFVIKVLNERGKKYAEVNIGYDSTYEKVELVYAHTIRPDLEVVPVGGKHIRDVSRYLNFPLYSNARALIISMPEVTEGAIIEYKVRRHRSQLINKKDFFIVYPLQDSEPVREAHFTVTVPKQPPLNILCINEEFNDTHASLEPQIREDGENKVFQWDFKDVPEIIPEPSMPSTLEVNPMVLVSTFKSWDEIYNWWQDLARDKIAVNDEMKQLVSGLVEASDTPVQKTRSIVHWCIQNIRYVAIEYGQAGYEPHSAVEIFQNKYGDCKDQAILLIALLRQAGIEAYPVFILTQGHFEFTKEFPILLFNHAIAAVNLEGRLTFVDPTAETVPFGDLPQDDQDRKVFVLKADTWQIVPTPLFPAEHNRTLTDMTVRINDDESISVERNVFTYGYFDQGQRYGLKYTKPILYEESLRRAVNDFSAGGRLLDYTIRNLDTLDKPIELSYQFSGSDYLARAGRARAIGQLGDIGLDAVSKEGRRYPIDFGILTDRETKVSIILPGHLQVKFLPEPVSLDTAWMSFANVYEQQDNRIVFTQKVVMKKRTLLQGDYMQFKALLEETSRKLNQCTILEEVPAAGQSQ